jgi:hypothetical protein
MKRPAQRDVWSPLRRRGAGQQTGEPTIRWDATGQHRWERLTSPDGPVPPGNAGWHSGGPVLTRMESVTWAAAPRHPLGSQVSRSKPTVSAATQAGTPFSRSPRVQNPCPQSTSHNQTCLRDSATPAARTARSAMLRLHRRLGPAGGWASQQLPCSDTTRPTRCSCSELASRPPVVTRGSARALLVSCRTALRSIRRSYDRPPTEGWLDPAGKRPWSRAVERPRCDAPGSLGPGTTRGGRRVPPMAGRQRPVPLLWCSRGLGSSGAGWKEATCWN